MNVFRRRLLVQQAQEGVAEYAACSYIENPGSAYVDTGVVPEAGIKLDMTLEITLFEPWKMWLGARTQNELNGYFISHHAYEGWLMYQLGSAQSRTVQAGTLNRKFRLISEGDSLTVDDKVFTEPVSVYPDALSIFLFGLNLGGAYDGGNRGLRIYGCKIYKSGALIRDFVPVVRTSDGTYGLYDNVGKKFYTSPNNEKFKGVTK